MQTEDKFDSKLKYQDLGYSKVNLSKMKMYLKPEGNFEEISHNFHDTRERLKMIAHLQL